MPRPRTLQERRNGRQIPAVWAWFNFLGASGSCWGTRGRGRGRRGRWGRGRGRGRGRINCSGCNLAAADLILLSSSDNGKSHEGSFIESPRQHCWLPQSYLQYSFAKKFLKDFSCTISLNWQCRSLPSSLSVTSIITYWGKTHLYISRLLLVDHHIRWFFYLALRGDGFGASSHWWFHWCAHWQFVQFQDE